MKELFFTGFGLECYDNEFSLYTEVNDIVLVVLIKDHQGLYVCVPYLISIFDSDNDTIDNYRISNGIFGSYVYYE